jgi:hypothetical protein
LTTAHAELRKEPKRNHWRWSAYLTRAFFLALLSLPTAEGRAPVISPWLFAITVPIALMARAGQLSENG